MPASPPAADAIPIPDAITAPQRALIRAEVLLDRAHFSPGVIDGADGSNLKLAVSAFEDANSLPVDGKVSDALIAKLTATDTANSVKRYTITPEDVAGPFVAKLPTDFADLAKLDSPAYSGPVEELAERFHMDEALLQGAQSRAPTSALPAPRSPCRGRRRQAARQVAKIEVDKTKQAVRAYGDGGKLLASLSGHGRQRPSGRRRPALAVRTVAPEARPTPMIPSRLTFGKASGQADDQARPEQPGGLDVDRPDQGDLRHPRHARPADGRQERLARLRSPDQLGRARARRIGQAGGDGGVHGEGDAGLRAGKGKSKFSRCNNEVGMF